MTIGTLAPTVDAVDVRNPRYQELKSRVHDTLLSRLNLERLTETKREDAEPEIRGLIADLLEREAADHAAQPVRARERSSPTSSTSCSAWGRSRPC